jgi:pimeloyl-ACP methyl ester carboxylesterase
MLPSVKRAAILTVAALTLLVSGLLFAGRIQAGPDVEVQEVFFTGKSGAQMRALLFQPKSATAQTPRPAILAVHGYLNNGEIQANFATEYARRGYVVLAPDQRGHGSSDGPSFADGFGGPDALAYLRSLPFVDTDNIGLEGHSMGGWTVLAAAKAHPDGYRSLILEGSSVGPPFAPEGTKAFPRNLLVVFGTRDEFGGFMWGPEAPLKTGETARAKVLFGTDQPVVPGRLYGDIAQGTARMLLTPFVTHAWLHQSATGITPALQWFDRTLDGGNGLAADDQIWPWREGGNALALLAVPGLILGLFALTFRAMGGAAIAASPSTAPRTVDRRFARLAALAIVPFVLYLPVCMVAELLLPANAVLSQTFSNQLAAWALVSAALAWVTVRRAPVPAAPLTGWRPGLAASLAALGITMAMLTLGQALAHVDASWWFITLRPLTPARAFAFAVYLPAFMAFAILSLRAVDTFRPLEQGSALSGWTVAALTLAGGGALFLAIQYGALALTGALLIPQEGLRTIIAIGFLPLFAAIALFGVASRRWTGSVLPGAILSGLFATWFLTSVQPFGV